VVNVGQLVDRSARLVNTVVLVFFILENIKYFTGVDIIESIRKAPPFDYRAIVAQYPWLFNTLSLSLAFLVMADQVVLSRVYRGRVMPPTGYAAAISGAILGISLTLIIFLRDTPLLWYYVYFAAIPAFALLHLLLIRSGLLSEIREPVLGEELVPRAEELVGRGPASAQSIYPAPHPVSRRRVIR
jgi:hypothetical protein